MEVNMGHDFDDVMLVPQTSSLKTRADADISCEVVNGIRRDVPIISANMPSVTGPDLAVAMWNAGAYSVLHRFNSVDENVVDYLSVVSQGADCACSIGLKDGISRLEALVKKGCTVFVLDVAHGDHVSVYELTQMITSLYPSVKLIVGNIATPSAAVKLAEAGAHAVKVGIGSGAACTTRKVTGFGVPQLTAISTIFERAYEKDLDINIIADGGIRTSGDIVKALAAGADAVMIGSLLAGTDESPFPGIYYGNASSHVKNYRAPEGVTVSVTLSGSAESVVKSLAWGIRSGFSYGGATDVDELRSNVTWVRVNRG